MISLIRRYDFINNNNCPTCKFVGHYKDHDFYNCGYVSSGYFIISNGGLIYDKKALYEEFINVKYGNYNFKSISCAFILA
jgi:hypothetical protein